MLTNGSVPASTVIPELVYEDVAAASAWLCDTFGFTERLRAGNHRAQLDVGDGAVVLTEQRVGQGFDSPDDAEFRPPRRGEVSHSVMVRVEDADAHHERAARGARGSCRPPPTTPSGSGSTPRRISRATAGRSPSPSPTSLPRSGAARRA